MVPLFPPDVPPAGLFPGFSLEPEEARSILRPQKDDQFGFGYALSPYRGCSHACRYCYVRDYPHAIHPPEAWGSWVAPKVNAPELLWAQRHKLHGEAVFLASATDPYQPAERHFELTRRCLEVLLQCPETRVLVHTRASLVLRDLDLLKAFGPRLSVGISIPTDDDTVRQVLEPRAPAIPTRWVTAERLAKAGIAVSIAATPLLPMTDPAAFARRVRESGVQKAWVGRLRLLKDDPILDILEAHGWLDCLRPEPAEHLRDLLATTLPPSRRSPRRKAAQRSQVAPSRTLLLQARQPLLFEGL